MCFFFVLVCVNTEIPGYFVESYILTAVSMKSTVLCFMTPLGYACLTGTNISGGGAYCLQVRIAYRNLYVILLISYCRPG